MGGMPGGKPSRGPVGGSPALVACSPDREKEIHVLFLIGGCANSQAVLGRSPAGALRRRSHIFFDPFFATKRHKTKRTNAWSHTLSEVDVMRSRLMSLGTRL